MDKMDVFKLYQREKVITLKDNSGNEGSILLAKPNQVEADKISEYYQKKIEEYTENIIKTTSTVFEEQTKELSKKELIDAIIAIEKARVNADKDLAVDVLRDGKKRDEAEVKEAEDDAVAQWEKERREILNENKPAFLRKLFANYTISSMAIANAMADWDKVAICYICHPVGKRSEYIFSINKDDPNFVGNASPELIGKLTEEINDFILVKTQRDVRRLAESPDFTQATGSGAP